MSTLVASAGGYWKLRVKGTLTVRHDTGAVNHSPTSSAPLTVRLQYGCSHTIRIPGELYVLFYRVYQQCMSRISILNTEAKIVK